MSKAPIKYLQEEDLTKDGGVIKKIIRHGESDGLGCMPLPGQSVVIEYEARLENGAIADRSSAHQKDGEPFSFVVGLGNVIDGWDIGVMNMQLGEKCDIFITSKYAFGDEGRPPKIPPKAPVIFNVELIQIGDRKSEKRMRNHLGAGALLKDAEASKKLGNEAFKAKSYKEATEYYTEGLELLVIGEDKEKDETQAQAGKDLAVAMHQNSAICFNNLEEYAEAIRHCQEAIKINSFSAKAYYVKSQAYSKQKEWDSALTEMKACIMLQPKDKKLRVEYENIQKEKAKANQGIGSRISEFFSQGVYNEKKTNLKKQRPPKIYEYLPDFDQDHVQCFFEISIGFNNEKDRETGYVVFELFDHTVPETCENFRALCTGERAHDLSYLNTRIHRIVREFMMQGGDNSNGEPGKGGKGIYKEGDSIHNKDGLFDDENIWYPHSHAGVLSMAALEGKKNQNGSQFCISLREDNQYFEEKNTVIGRVIKGLDFILSLQDNCEIHEEKPVRPLMITSCGELTFGDKLAKEQAVDLDAYIVTAKMEKAIQSRRDYKKKHQEAYQKELAERAERQKQQAKEDAEKKQQELEEKKQEQEAKAEAAKTPEKSEEKAKKPEAKADPPTKSRRDETETYVEELD